MCSSPTPIIQDPASQLSYTQLVKALHPPNPAILEIDILPSTYAPEILYSHPALALPKTLLASLYLIARKLVFKHLSESGQERVKHHEALQATSVILLWDPNHLTASNFRKHHLQSLSTTWTQGGHGEEDGKRLMLAVQWELNFLDSLVTSPLKKHTKASTLWHQRLWIMENLLPQALREGGYSSDLPRGSDCASLRRLWTEELGIVMKAGERHPKNYYAWQYARQLSRILQGTRDEDVAKEGGRKSVGWSVGMVHAWCLMHPRDISGWGFLAFLLDTLQDSEVTSGQVTLGEEEKRVMKVQRVARETERWVRKYEWKGESMEWFLRTVDQLAI